VTPFEASIPRFRPAGDVGEWPEGLLVASPEWFSALAQIVAEEVALAPAHLAGASLFFQEVFTNVAPEGDDVAWQLRLEDGVITELHYGEPVVDPQLEQALTWEESLPLCRMPKSHPDYVKLKDGLAERGHLRLRGDAADWAVFRELFGGLHDRVVLRTR
jgi:hypothetical protein